MNMMPPPVYRPNVTSSLQPKLSPGAPKVYRPANSIGPAPPVYRPNFAAPVQQKPVPAAAQLHWPPPAIQLRRSKRATWNAKQIAQNERLFRRRAERQERYAKAAEREKEKASLQQADIEAKLEILEDEFATAGSTPYQKTVFETTSTVANLLGQRWVGAEATGAFYGASAWHALVSKDGKRQYRPPMPKLSGKAAGSFQANYEAKKGAGAAFTFNAHVTITNLATGDAWNELKKAQPRS